MSIPSCFRRRSPPLGDTAARPSRVDLATVESLARVLAGQRRLEDSIGSAAVVPAVRAQLRAIEGMVADARGAVRRDLLDVAAQWAQFAGWLHTNVGRYADGLKWLGRTLEWATEIDDRQLVGRSCHGRGTSPSGAATSGR